MTSRPAAARLLPVIAGLLAAAIALLLVGWDGLDLAVYRYGGLTARTEPGALYNPTTGRPGDPGLPFTYPPVAALMFIPLSFIPHGAGYVLISLLTLGLTVLVAADLAPRLRARLPRGAAAAAPWVIWPVLTAACLLTGPFRDTLSFGQVNVILMAVCYLALARLGLGFWTGVVIGVCGGIKLTPLALGVLPGARRRWDCVAGIATGFLAAGGLGYAVLPQASNQYWWHVLGDPARIGHLNYIDNVSLRGVLARWGSEGSLLWAGLSLLVVAAIWWFLARVRDAADDVELLGAAALPMLAISPVTWSHHWVWLPCLGLSLLAVRGCVTRGVAHGLAVVAATMTAYLALSPKLVLRACGQHPDGAVPAGLAHLSDLPALGALLLAGILAWGARSARGAGRCAGCAERGGAEAGGLGGREGSGGGEAEAGRPGPTGPQTGDDMTGGGA